MIELLHIFAVGLAALTGLMNQPAKIEVAPPQLAVIHSAMMPLPGLAAPSSTATSTTATSTAGLTVASATPSDILVGLLPKVYLRPSKFGRLVLVTSTLSFPSASLPPKKPAPTSTPPVIAPRPAPPALVALSVASAASSSTPKPVGTPAPAPQIAMTAQSFLDKTTISLKQGVNSLERVTFNTDLGVAGKVSWNLLSTAVGGATSSIPQFAVSSSCLPVPTAADPNDLDQNPWFDPRTSYTCTLLATPESGTDRRTVSKDIAFQTDPGRLVVSAASNLNSVLQDNQNNGGLVFDNQDTMPITVTGLTVDASFTALNTSTPLVLRFANPTDGSSLFDYHLEAIPTDPSTPYTATQTGIAVTLTLTIPANSSRMLPVEALGVRKWQLSGSSPTVKVTVRALTATRSDFKTTLVSPQVLWTCIVPTSAYNPYATSSPFLTGQACQN